MRAMSGVLSHSGRPNSEARVTLSRYIVSRSLRHVLGKPGNSFLVAHDRERVGRVEQVLGELRSQPCQLLLDRGEARLPVRRQLGASQAEVAQRVVDDFSPGV